jgi:aminobenzoyl-glutamate utilization protein B
LAADRAEKVFGSKPVHAAAGYYDGADVFISYHPHFTNTAILDTQCGSYWSVVFTFETTEPEKGIDKSLIPTTHTSYAAARCPGAIDALCLMYTTTK